MAIIDDKREIFGDIAALNTLLDRMPKLNKNSSLESVNNGKDPMKFLADVLVVLADLNALKDITIDVITYQLPRLEEDIKEALKDILKENFDCDINPSIPADFKSTGNGVNIPVKSIDFFDIMKTDPTTIEGKLLYSDVDAGVNSKDFNTYLNGTIQNNGTDELFGASVSGNDFIISRFDQTNINGNNMMNFKTSSNYDTDKSIVDWNNDYINSISLFGNPDSLDSKMMLNLILEELFSSFSSSNKVNKSEKQIKSEVEVKKVLQKIIESDDLIQPEAYTFTNKELSDINISVDNKKRGVLPANCCENVEISIPESLIKDINNDFDLLGNNDKSAELNIVEKSLDNLANTQADQSPTDDVDSIKYNFFKEIIDKLMLILMTQMISPKFVALLMINFTISNGGVPPTYNNAIEFIRQNEKVFNAIRKRIIQSIIAIILIFALRLLLRKLVVKKIGDKVEKASNYAKALFSYLPVSPEYKELLYKII